MEKLTNVFKFRTRYMYMYSKHAQTFNTGSISSENSFHTLPFGFEVSHTGYHSSVVSCSVSLFFFPRKRPLKHHYSTISKLMRYLTTLEREKSKSRVLFQFIYIFLHTGNSNNQESCLFFFALRITSH